MPGSSVARGDEGVDTATFEDRALLHDVSAEHPTGAIEITGLSRRQLDLLVLETSALESSVEPAPDTWHHWLTIHTLEQGDLAAARRKPAVLGTYRLRDRSLLFSPRFPWVAGQPYLVVWRPPGAAPDKNPLETVLSLPMPDAPSTATVLEVFPSSTMVPENLLKVYVQFSAPMSRGVARHHLRLWRDDGKEVEAPFVAPEHELWNPTSDRLTLFFDPGRLKRGVAPNQAMGAPLEVGRSYRLEVDAHWPDATGRPLRASFQQAWTVVAADRVSPRPFTWRVETPKEPLAPLSVHFKEPLDWALLQHAITVHDAAGKTLDGDVSIDRHEQRWQFVPRVAWRNGSFYLRVQRILEDLAGNRPHRLFDEPLAEDVSPPRDSTPQDAVPAPPNEDPTLSIPFELDLRASSTI